MSDGIFRKKSLEKISSPEQINDYIKTSNPSVWIIFLAAMILLVGACVWCISGNIEITIDTVAVCDNGQAVCYVSEYNINKVSDKTLIRINNTDYTLRSVSELPIPAYDVLSEYELHIAGLDENEWVYIVNLNSDLSDGIYRTELIIDNVSPVSLLMN